MAISPEHAGRSYPATEPYEVSAAKIAEFARALGDDNPAYAGLDAIAPPTFAAVLAAGAWEAMFADEELGLALRRIVHGDQKFSWIRPLRAGDRVQAVLTIEKVRTRGAADIISSSVRIATVEGEDVCVAEATLFHSHEAAAWSVEVTVPEVGFELPPLAVAFTRADLVRYAGASTDFNPIHYSERFAAKVGLPGVVAHGMLTMGRALRVVTDWVGDPAAVTSYQVRFTKPVVVPDDDEGTTVTFTGKVSTVDGTLVTVAIEAVVVDPEGVEQKVLGAARAVVDLGT